MIEIISNLVLRRLTAPGPGPLYGDLGTFRAMTRNPLSYLIDEVDS